MTTTRHTAIRNLLANHAAGLLTDLDLVLALAQALQSYPCDCLACTE